MPHYAPNCFPFRENGLWPERAVAQSDDDFAAGESVLIVGPCLSDAHAHIGVVDDHERVAFAHRAVLVEANFADVALHAAVDGDYSSAAPCVIGELDVAEVNEFCRDPNCSGDNDGEADDVGYYFLARWFISVLS